MEMKQVSTCKHENIENLLEISLILVLLNVLMTLVILRQVSLDPS